MVGYAAVFTRTHSADIGPDARAIARCLAGDTAAFAEIVDRYQGMVASVVTRTLRNLDDADDVIQDVFVRAFRALGGFRGEARFSTWLYRIALHTAMRHAERQARDRRRRAEPMPEQTDHLADLPSDPDEGPEALVWKNISHARLRLAVHDLPDKHRVVIIMHYYEGKTCEEIAEVLNVRVGTVWSRIHYAVKALRSHMEGWR